METFNSYFTKLKNNEIDFVDIPLMEDLEAFICPFLIENNKPICLEVNAFWGMGMGIISYPYNSNLKQYLLDNYKNLKNIVPNIYERMDQYNLWKKFYEIL